MNFDSDIPQVHQRKAGPDQFDSNAQAGWEEISEHREKVQLNPIWGMLRRPTETLNTIYRLDYPIIWPLLLIVVAGISFSLNQFIAGMDPSVGALVMTTLFGALAAMILAAINCASITWIGRLLGGTGSFKRVLVAWGWSSAPSFLILIIWGIRFSIVGPGFFDGGSIPDTEQSLGLRSLVYLTILSAILMVWQMILTVKAISIAHQMRKLKALFACIVLPALAGIIVGVIA